MFESEYITCSINADNHDNMFRVFSEFFKSVVDVTPLTSEFFKVFSECFQNVVVANPMFQSVFRIFQSVVTVFITFRHISECFQNVSEFVQSCFRVLLM